MDKLEGLEEGQRVRVTFEADIVDVDVDAIELRPINGTAGTMFDKLDIASDTFQIERIEPPLKVGDRVRGNGDVGNMLRGTIIGIDEGYAWVKWEPGAFTPADRTSWRLSDLERIA